jgi:hypothetical protein
MTSAISHTHWLSTWTPSMLTNPSRSQRFACLLTATWCSGNMGHHVRRRG